MVYFSGLHKDVIRKVVDKEVGLLSDMLTEKQVTLELSEASRDWLAAHG